jgi:hypothetical protein
MMTDAPFDAITKTIMMIIILIIIIIIIIMEHNAGAPGAMCTVSAGGLGFGAVGVCSWSGYRCEAVVLQTTCCKPFSTIIYIHVVVHVCLYYVKYVRRCLPQGAILTAIAVDIIAIIMMFHKVFFNLVIILTIMIEAAALHIIMLSSGGGVASCQAWVSSCQAVVISGQAVGTIMPCNADSAAPSSLSRDWVPFVLAGVG